MVKSEYDGIYRKFMPIALRVARSQMFFGFRRNGVEIADIEQDACLKLHEFLSTAKTLPSEGLMRRIIEKDLLDLYKKRKGEINSLHEEYEDRADCRELIDRETMMDIDNAIKNSDLDSEEQTIIKMRQMGRRNSEIAELFDVTPGAISNKLQKIFKKIRKSVNK